MGEVYLADDPVLGRKVAMKRVSVSGTSPDALARLRREAQAAARISHPGVAAVYDVIEADGTPYVVMEYVPGTDLQTVRAERPASAREVVATGVALASAVAAAHAQGVIHRDLKPSNIRVLPDGQMKILDFGISKLVDPRPAADAPTDVSPALTGIGDSLGTPGYSAPEQLLGQPVDVRADVFSLGVTLYELATGKAPFRRDTAFATVIASMQQPPPRADAINAAIPAPLAAALNRAMAADPEARFPTMTAFAEALREAMAEAAPGGLRGRLPRRAGWAAVVAAAVLLGVLAVLTMRGGWSTGDAPTVARARPGDLPVVALLPPANLSGDEQNDFLAVGLGDSLFTDLSGLAGIRVVSPADVRADALTPGADPRAIARTLGAAFVVEASVQRVGSLVRINARLLTADGTVVWRDDLQGEMAEVFDLQRRFASGVIGGLDLRTTSEQRARLDVPATTNVGALADYWRGRALLERADLPSRVEAAIVAFDAAIAKDEGFAEAYAGLGEAWWAHYGHTSDATAAARAVDASERALALDASQARIWITLALVRNGTGRPDEALDDLRRAITLQPANDDAHRLMGDVLASRADWAAAEAAYRAAIALRPGFWRNHYRLGVLFYRVGRFDEAVSAFRDATTLEPGAAAGYQAMGTVLQAAGDLTGAREQYERALAIGPTRNAYSNLGILYYWEGRPAEAARAFREAIARYPDEAVFHRNLGDALRRLGEGRQAEASYALAATLYERRLEVNAEDAVVLADLAVVEMKRGHAARAREYIARAQAAAPGDADVLYSLAVVLNLSGRTADALPVLEQALAAGASVLSVQHDDDLAAVRALPAFRLPTGTP